MYRNSTQRIFVYLKSLFVHGLFTLLPMIITAALLSLCFRLIKSWLTPIYNLEPAFLKRIPQSEIIVTLMIILLTGILYDLFLKDLLYKIEVSILKKIPLLSLIYFGVKRLAEALTAKGNNAVHQVMLVEFPSKGIYSIGFLTSSTTAAWLPELEGDHVSLFVPHTPNPTTGFYVVVPAQHCRPLSLTRQEAMTLVISGGLITPQRVGLTTEDSETH